MSVDFVERAPTGIEGLDEILGGGAPRGRAMLLAGEPGTGKTTMALQFLLAGVQAGERSLYCSLLQSESEMDDLFRSHGWRRDGVELLELPERVRDEAEREQTVFATSDVELHEAVDAIVDTIERVRPDRLVLDSVTELSMLMESPYQLRRRLMRVKRVIAKVGCTSILTASDPRDAGPSMQTIVTGSVRLSVSPRAYGPPYRRILVEKVRGLDFAMGEHDFRIATGGIVVYPRTRAEPDGDGGPMTPVSCGVPEMDRMLGGGLESGTACLISGDSGAGKSTVAGLYVRALVETDGAPVAVHCFDERRATFLRRMANLGMDLVGAVEDGRLDLREYNVGDVPPGEFVHRVRRSVEERGVRAIVVDSLDGYLKSAPDGDLLVPQLHDLIGYLHAKDVLILMTATSSAPFGDLHTELDASYLADTILLMRHFEAFGRVRRCVSVLKKRAGSHEATVRELTMGPGGVQVGKPLRSFSGVLSGRLTFHGKDGHLLEEDRSDEDDG